MTSWQHKRLLKVRQLPDQIAPPPAMAGISGEVVLDPNAVSTGAFAFDASAVPDAARQTAPPLAGTLIPHVTIGPDATPSQSGITPSQTNPASASSASHVIPMSTVVGACVGAFAGACLIIIGSVWFYRRSTRAMMAKHRHGNADRRKETWNQLGEDEDKWDGGMTELDQGKATVARTPTEKLGVFKKSLSMRTTRTEKSDAPSFESQTFAPYHPKLALELAGATATTETNSRAESQVLSWNGGFLGSLRNERVGSGGMSPSLNKAIPTPIAVTSTDSHPWQSAEVLNLEGMSAEVEEAKPDSRPSTENPFYDPKDQEYMVRAKEHSRGKQKDVNPFGDDAQADTLAPASHTDSAIQSLIAALGVDGSDPHNPSPFSPPYNSTATTFDHNAVTGDVQPHLRT